MNSDADAPRARTLHGRRLRRALVLLCVSVTVLACAASDGELSGDPDRGEQLYGAHCVACHGGATGGEISDVPPRHNAEGHTWHHPDCELVEIVLEGMPQRPGHPSMPAFRDRLDEEDVHDILAHIRTWWEDDQREHQREVTEQVCA
jgi:mono/diheme cytochrome c family protein